MSIAQDPERHTNHNEGWTECFVGDFLKAEGYIGQFASHTLDSGVHIPSVVGDENLYEILAYGFMAEEQLPTYGDLQKYFSENPLQP